MRYGLGERAVCAVVQRRKVRVGTKVRRVRIGNRTLKVSHGHVTVHFAADQQRLTLRFKLAQGRTRTRTIAR